MSPYGRSRRKALDLELNLPRRDGHDFSTLATALGRVKADHHDKDDAIVASEDQIDFATLLATMDAVLTAGFPAVSLEDAAAAPERDWEAAQQRGDPSSGNLGDISPRFSGERDRAHAMPPPICFFRALRLPDRRPQPR